MSIWSRVRRWWARVTYDELLDRVGKVERRDCGVPCRTLASRVSRLEAGLGRRSNTEELSRRVDELDRAFSWIKTNIDPSPLEDDLDRLSLRVARLETKPQTRSVSRAKKKSHKGVRDAGASYIASALGSKRKAIRK